MASAIVRLAKEFVIVINKMVVARATDFSLSLNRQVIDVTSFDTDGWVEKVSDNKDWSVNFSAMVTRSYGKGDGGTGIGSGTFNNLYDLWISATGDYPVSVAIGDPTTGTAASGNYFAGKGLIVSLNPQGSVGDKMTFSGTIEGAGKLTRGSKS